MTIPWNQLVIICPLVFIAGFIDAIAGGGGLISLTAYNAIGLPPDMALGTNKLSASPACLVASIRYIKAKNYVWNAALVAAIGALIGSSLGSNLVLHINQKYLQYILIVLVPALMIFTIAKPDLGIAKKKMEGPSMLATSFAIGLIIGAYDGFFGPGTGMFLTMAFTALVGFDVATSSGNARIINFASGIAALITYIINGKVNYVIGIPCVVFSMVGSWLGAGLTIKNGTKIVRPVMVIVLLILLGKIIFDLFF